MEYTTTYLEDLSKRDRRYIEDAVNVAASSDFSIYKLGAVLVGQNKKEVFKGCNQLFENGSKRARLAKKEEENEYFSVHAEINVLLKYLKHIGNNITFRKVDEISCKNVDKSTVYIVRLSNKDGVLGNAMPCYFCQRLLRKFNVRCVKYTDNIDGENVLCEMRLN